MGLGISGTEDNSALYTQALRAVDGLCDTCASATDPEGNYFTVVLPVSGAARPPGCLRLLSLLAGQVTGGE